MQELSWPRTWLPGRSPRHRSRSRRCRSGRRRPCDRCRSRHNTDPVSNRARPARISSIVLRTLPAQLDCRQTPGPDCGTPGNGGGFSPTQPKPDGQGDGLPSFASVMQSAVPPSALTHWPPEHAALVGRGGPALAAVGWVGGRVRADVAAAVAGAVGRGAGAAGVRAGRRHAGIRGRSGSPGAGGLATGRSVAAAAGRTVRGRGPRGGAAGRGTWCAPAPRCRRRWRAVPRLGDRAARAGRTSRGARARVGRAGGRAAGVDRGR